MNIDWYLLAKDTDFRPFNEMYQIMLAIIVSDSKLVNATQPFNECGTNGSRYACDM